MSVRSDHLSFTGELGDELIDALDHLTCLTLTGETVADHGDLRGVDLNVKIIWLEGLKRLLLSLHDVREGRVARLVESQVGGHDRGEAELYGLNALAPASKAREVARRVSDEDRLERGPAFSEPVRDAGQRPGDWPTYRHDPQRSGFTQHLAELWKAAVA